MFFSMQSLGNRGPRSSGGGSEYRNLCAVDWSITIVYANPYAPAIASTTIVSAIVYATTGSAANPNVRATTIVSAIVYATTGSAANPNVRATTIVSAIVYVPAIASTTIAYAIIYANPYAPVTASIVVVAVNIAAGSFRRSA